MAPFPSRHARKGSNSLLPTMHSFPPTSSSSSTSAQPYPSLPSSTATTPSGSPRHSISSQSNQAGDANGGGRDAHLDPRALFGGVLPPSAGSVGGLGGISAESRETVRRCLEENHISAHTFFNDKGFHNHCAHHLLAAYSLGATPSLLEDIFKLHQEQAFKPMPPLIPVEISEKNWLDHLGDERFYPNYLRFFHRLISAPPHLGNPYAAKGHKTSAIPVLEYYLFGGQGQMLLRAVSGALHPLIHIGHGVEFGLDAVVAEGLAQCAVHAAKTTNLFPIAEGGTWPPQPPKPASIAGTFSSAFSALRFSSAPAKPAPSRLTPSATHPIADGRESVAKSAGLLPRGDEDKRYPRQGLSGFSILDRILHDDALAPGRACHLDAMPKLDAVLENDEAAARLRAWCDEWKFSTQVSAGWEDQAGRSSDEDSDEERREKAAAQTHKGYGVPKWSEIVEKYEELVWMATVIHAASSRPGYRKTKLDFFIMHGLTSVLFLPPLLQAISPHLRPYLLTSHFRLIIAYWVSRGRPPLYVSETLMAASSRPLPPRSASKPSSTAVNRALQEVLREKHSSNSRPSSPPPHEGYGESPLTPKAEGSVLPFSEAEDEQERIEDDGTNPWMRVLQSAVDHHDEHVTKAVRSLFYAATHFGASPKGMFQSSLPGTSEMDGSIFIRAAGLTLDSVGWAHEGSSGNVGTWDRSGLGWPETWQNDALLPGREWPPAGKGKGRADPSGTALSPSTSPYTDFSRSFSNNSSSSSHSNGYPSHPQALKPQRSRSGTVTAADEEVVQFSSRDSALLSPSLSLKSATALSFDHHIPGAVDSRSSSPSSASGANEARAGWRKVGEEVTPEEEQARRERAEQEENERELMG